MLVAVVTSVCASFIYDAVRIRLPAHASSPAPSQEPESVDEDTVKPEEKFYRAVVAYYRAPIFAKNPDRDHIHCLYEIDYNGALTDELLTPDKPLTIYMRNRPVIVRFGYHRDEDMVMSGYFSLDSIAFTGRYPNKTERQEATPHSMSININNDVVVEHDGHFLEATTNTDE